MAKTILARADQMNAEDFLAGPATFTVDRVTVKPSSEDQPVSIYMVGYDPKKPFKPCKTFRRVLVDIWGGDSRAYAGKSMTLFRNPDVMFQGEKVGGIEISHMSGIDSPRTLKLTATRGKKRTITIHPLKTDTPEHALQKPLADLKQKWWTVKKSEMTTFAKEQIEEAFGTWVENTSDRAVMDTDANKPSFYNQSVIDHLNAVLGE